MTSERQPIGLATAASWPDADVSDRRAQAKREQELLLAARQQRLSGLTSVDKSPEERVKLWEELFALPLPRNRSHTLVRIIAQQTGLSVAQIHAEQLRRATPS
jgi:hypothetical protein